MVFSSSFFLFLFLPLTLFIYYALRDSFRNIFFLIASLIFFAWSQWNYLWVILVNIVVNYVGAYLMTKIYGGAKRKLFLSVIVLVNLSLLFYFKYFNFFMDSLHSVFGFPFEPEKIILPIGISFFTFQGLSYVIDVYRGGQNVLQKNLVRLALYIVLFPQLIAGPIVRYTDIAKELVSRHVDIELFASGVRRFIIGFAKKVIIANTMAAVADSVWGQTYNTVAVAWIGSVAYTLQIYFDFSGYSDMAIGLGRMFGFHFRENFDFPYTASSVSEFWRRWHISLSSWFRDYVYIPLGGSRNHLYRNLLFVFLLTGIWHGAAWNFVFWGLWHGAFVLAERFLQSRGVVLSEGLVAKFMAHVYTLLVVHIGWVLFRAGSLQSGVNFIMTMFGAPSKGVPGFLPAWYLDNYTVFIFVMAVLFSSTIPQIVYAYVNQYFSQNMMRATGHLVLLLVFSFAVIRMVAGTYNPFIYFRF